MTAEELYPHTRSESGHNFVQSTGEMTIALDFATRRHSDLFLRINGVLVARKSHPGTIAEKVVYARKLLVGFATDLAVFRDVVDGGIAQQERKAKELREKLDKAEADAQFLRNLEI